MKGLLSPDAYIRPVQRAIAGAGEYISGTANSMYDSFMRPGVVGEMTNPNKTRLTDESRYNWGMMSNEEKYAYEASKRAQNPLYANR